MSVRRQEVWLTKCLHRNSYYGEQFLVRELSNSKLITETPRAKDPELKTTSLIGLIRFPTSQSRLRWWQIRDSKFHWSSVSFNIPNFFHALSTFQRLAVPLLYLSHQSWMLYLSSFLGYFLKYLLISFLPAILCDLWNFVPLYFPFLQILSLIAWQHFLEIGNGAKSWELRLVGGFLWPSRPLRLKLVPWKSWRKKLQGNHCKDLPASIPLDPIPATRKNTRAMKNIILFQLSKHKTKF